jgi:isoamylase
MFQGGDEMLRTQYGNNNAYNLDDSAMWLDWSLATTNASFVSWTTALFAFRAAHPALRPATFFTGTDHNGNGLPDIEWLDNTGAVASAAYLANTANHFLAWRIDGTEAAIPRGSLLFVWNGWTADISMPVPVRRRPARRGGASGTARAGRSRLPGSETAFTGTVVDAPPRSVTVLIER